MARINTQQDLKRVVAQHQKPFRTLLEKIGASYFPEQQVELTASEMETREQFEAAFRLFVKHGTVKRAIAYFRELYPKLSKQTAYRKFRQAANVFSPMNKIDKAGMLAFYKETQLELLATAQKKMKKSGDPKWAEIVRKLLTDLIALENENNEDKMGDLFHKLAKSQGNITFTTNPDVLNETNVIDVDFEVIEQYDQDLFE